MDSKSFIRLELVNNNENLACEISGKLGDVEAMFVGGIVNFVNQCVKDKKVDTWLKDFKDLLDEGIKNRKQLDKSTEQYSSKLDYLLNNINNTKIE